jgi:hypothetical protein
VQTQGKVFLSAKIEWIKSPVITLTGLSRLISGTVNPRTGHLLFNEENRMIYTYACGHTAEGKYAPSERITKCPDCYRKRFEGLSVEEIRGIRQEKLDRKSARRAGWVKSALKKADEIRAYTDKFRGDYAFNTQPANPNSSFGRFRDRINRRSDKEYELRQKAENHLSHVGVIAVVKGDAERRYQARRDANDLVIFIGSKITDIIFGDGVVIKKNKKTYTIKWDKSGNTWTRDKEYVKLIKKDN